MIVVLKEQLMAGQVDIKSYLAEISSNNQPQDGLSLFYDEKVKVETRDFQKYFIVNFMKDDFQLIA